MGIKLYKKFLGGKYYTTEEWKKLLRQNKELSASLINIRGRKSTGKTPTDTSLLCKEDISSQSLEFRLFSKNYKNFSLFVDCENYLWLETVTGNGSVKIPYKKLKIGVFLWDGKICEFSYSGLNLDKVMKRLDSDIATLQKRIKLIQDKILGGYIGTKSFVERDIIVTYHNEGMRKGTFSVKREDDLPTHRENSGVSPYALKTKKLTTAVQVN